MRVVSADTMTHPKANDLKYGSVLYALYQGHAFEALSVLNVAKLRGGIRGHRNHPALLEGSLMLSYGMTHEAKVLFESLLLNESGDVNKNVVDYSIVSESARNQAWFYLGKVLMLEQDFNASLEALQHVDSTILKQNQPAMFYEWLYLKGLIVEKLSVNNDEKSPIEKPRLPTDIAGQYSTESTIKVTNDPQKLYQWLYDNNQISKEAAELLSHNESYIWQAYFRYNLAVKFVNEARFETATVLFNSLDADLSEWLLTDEVNFAELSALKDQNLLSLGQLYIVQNNFDQALITLKRIQIESVFSDQALYTYAVAAASLQKFGLALQALNTLKDRALFSPWRQQTPYALAYLYEQLGESELALEAYSAAVMHYEKLAVQLTRDHAQVTEERILNALSLQEASIEPGMLREREIPLALGRTRVANDAYGYLQVNPNDFNYAELLATEPFQLSLRDLHELYKLKFSLERWENQLDSFDSMMATRQTLRAQRISHTLSVMTAQKSEQWVKQQQAFLREFNQESKAENSEFFMDDEQQEYHSIIQRMVKNLSYLPQGDERAEFDVKIKRMQAYFSWWVDDQYSVNRWTSEKQLKGLTHEVELFKQRNKALTKQVNSDQENQALVARIDEGRRRLKKLKQSLNQNLEQSRAKLVMLVKDELTRQHEETQKYLLAASTAQARMADMLFLNTSKEESAKPTSSKVKEGVQ